MGNLDIKFSLCLIFLTLSQQSFGASDDIRDLCIPSLSLAALPDAEQASLLRHINGKTDFKSMSIRVREHRGSLEDSMRTVREILPTLTALSSLINSSLGYSVEPTSIKVTPYAGDEHIGWNTYIVTIEGLGVYGFTDGPINEEM